ncbi:LANO_0C05226g1_1 [Lachancea nothofagi CBS 11611]|uniref:LANO_0C05226g1_1 n=1 Tax=Lachancea nothofagi CBS 11611 TaxID=1266666 RepID=A0A1G4J7L6_9SACH|nr:LANO_0C05226g1_1 [Lachancea nothofagi CBS 11611]
MFLQALKVAVPRSARTFASTRVTANAIQDLYLREIKNVKLQPISAKDAEASVKPWNAPKAPQTPELEGQGPEALKAYAQEDVQVSKTEAESAAETEEQDWLVLEEIEEETHH